jgi:hypothetical protein
MPGNVSSRGVETAGTGGVALVVGAGAVVNAAASAAGRDGAAVEQPAESRANARASGTAALRARLANIPVLLPTGRLGPASALAVAIR